MLKTWRIFILSVVTLTSTLSFAGLQDITNLQAIAKSLKLSTFKGQKFTKKIKIAILDNGFNGWEDEVGAGKIIPDTDHYHAGPHSDADTRPEASYHGISMAQLVVGVIKESGAEADYDLHLFNASGITKFKDAVDKVIEQNFDIVLYSQVWEYGGNGDGKGFINAIVDKATQAGIIWINAAGNFGNLTYLGPVEGKVDGEHEWVHFKDKKGKDSDYIDIVCRGFKKGDKCGLRIVLSWNDFRDDLETGTEKDLDLYLFDKKNKEVVKSIRRQMLKPPPNSETTSGVPREFIERDVEPGSYKVKVDIVSKNFSATHDKLRITASNFGIDMIPHTTGETLLPPADNAGVIVVGASDDVLTSESKEKGLPKIFLKSLVKLKSKAVTYSTSNAAAMAAGLSVLFLGTGTEKTKDAVEAKLVEYSQPKKSKDTKDEDQISVPIDTSPSRSRSRVASNSPRAASGQGQCVPLQVQPKMYPALRDLLKLGGALLVNLNGFPAVSANYDYFARLGLNPRPGQKAFITPGGVTLLDEAQFRAYGLPPDAYAIVPSSVPVCHLR